MKKDTVTYTYENEIEFNNALATLDNIIACHFHYEYNAGYIVVEEQIKEEE
ncbi:hypothetical protein [Anaerobacillus arseniciselenatis]|uniref:hypothetical protein n=1 Tax=Anaerobacillus arseniciselenatis TaxID=85682 RepID=UPI0014710965|nr:hypothetical protein [Anaerobacillus arseniciselenatis]